MATTITTAASVEGGKLPPPWTSVSSLDRRMQRIHDSFAAADMQQRAHPLSRASRSSRQGTCCLTRGGSERRGAPLRIAALAAAQSRRKADRLDEPAPLTKSPDPGAGICRSKPRIRHHAAIGFDRLWVSEQFVRVFLVPAGGGVAHCGRGTMVPARRGRIFSGIDATEVWSEPSGTPRQDNSGEIRKRPKFHPTPFKTVWQ